jgi:hypothetical protein
LKYERAANARVKQRPAPALGRDEQLGDAGDDLVLRRRHRNGRTVDAESRAAAALRRP